MNNVPPKRTYMFLLLKRRVVEHRE